MYYYCKFFCIKCVSHYNVFYFTTAVDIRLVNGKTPAEGTVELLYNNTWGTYCNLTMRREAEVLCKMLGYPSGFRDKYSVPMSSSSTVWLSDVGCRGTETSIADCDHDGWGQTDKCIHEAVVACQSNYKFGIKDYAYYNGVI